MEEESLIISLVLHVYNLIVGIRRQSKASDAAEHADAITRPPEPEVACNLTRVLQLMGVQDSFGLFRKYLSPQVR